LLTMQVRAAEALNSPSQTALENWYSTPFRLVCTELSRAAAPARRSAPRRPWAARALDLPGRRCRRPAHADDVLHRAIGRDRGVIWLGVSLRLPTES
jgi:hypothetical protein